MATIVLAGWRAGMQKVALTQLQRELLPLSLKEAKENVDRVLESEENVLQLQNPVVLQAPDAVAAEFVRRASSLGALVGLVALNNQQQPVYGSTTPAQQAA